MELYSVQLERRKFGQQRYFAQTPSQVKIYNKYATVIKTFLSGITADVLRMRLKQAACANCMSIKHFLDSKKVNIIHALNQNRSFLLRVYPPDEKSADLMSWNTILLCLVLRASNCLSVREQEDFKYLAQIYRSYFCNKRQSVDGGTIPKSGTKAKREWIRVCSSVQRIVEVTNDTSLMKDVRNFICKVEMDTRAIRAKQETQLSLESFLAEIVTESPLSKHRKDVMADKIKKISQRQILNPASKMKQGNKRRPQSARGRLTMVHKSDDNFDTNKKKVIAISSRPMTADSSEFYKVTHKRSFLREKDPVLTLSSQQIDKERKCNNFGRTKYSAVRARPLSAADRNKISSPHNRRPKTAKEQKENDSRKIVDVDKSNSSITILRNKDRLSLKYANSDTEKRNRNDMNNENVTIPHARTANTYMYPNSPQKIEGKLSKTVQRELKSCPNEIADFVELDDKKYMKNGRVIHHKTVKYKENLKIPEDSKNRAQCQHESSDSEKTHVETTDETNKSRSKDIKQSNYFPNAFEGRLKTDKQKVFDENMKKIANEVLVHQQIHVAAKNPLLQDKEFVDEFFCFLNENHVTKKFLRAQSIEPHQSWKLSDGNHINFSFFLAFVFRHVSNKDLKMVSYIVEKMLLRMKCSHASDTADDENGPANSCDRKLSRKGKVTRTRSLSAERRSRLLSRGRNSPKRDKIASKRNDKEMPKFYRSTSITDNQCWKCIQKDIAMTACVNWSNRCLCDLLMSKGVPYREEHLSAAVKANDYVTVVKIVDFLKSRGNWNVHSKESTYALYLARKHGIRQIVDFLTKEGVRDERIVNYNACTSCFIA